MTHTIAAPLSAPGRATRALRALAVLVVLAGLGALPFAAALPTWVTLPPTVARALEVDLAPLNLTLVFMLGALSLNFLTGTAGVVSLGHAAFFATGAFAAALAGRAGWPFPAALAAATLAGALLGVIAGLPALRARGVTLLLSTFALHQVVRFALPELQRRLFGAGDLAYPSPAFGAFAIDAPVRWYFLLLAIVAVVYLAYANILRTRPGLAMAAMRDHDLAAAALGVDVGRLTLTVFAVSSGLAGLAGALFVYLAPGATPDGFGFDFAVSFIAMIVIGGLGSPTGALIGAALWRLAPPLVSAGLARAGDNPAAPWLAAHQPQLVAGLFGLATLLVLLSAPAGVAGLGRARSGARAR